MKRIIILIGLFLLLFGVHACAEEGWAYANMFEPVYTETDEDESSELFALNVGEITARDIIAKGMKNREKVINFSHCRVSLDRINYVVNAAYLENPECYYVNGYYQYHYITSGSSSYAFAVELTYLYTEEEVKAYDKVIENEKQHVLSLMDEDMTELEKVMLVHNYIATNHTYDYSYSIYNIYDFFTKRTGVCQAYALAMNYFLRAAGVECIHAYSYEMNHDWNLVKVDGNWYHVDVTWDDTWSNSENVVSYRYFLKSDDAFYNSLDHYGWDSEYEATSAWYDDYYFENYRFPFLYQNGEWYVLRAGNLYRINNLKYGGEELALKIGAKYKSGWHPDYDMSVAVYENSFIYNVYNEIYVDNLKDYAKPRKIATAEDINYKVYGLNVNRYILTYNTGRLEGDNAHTIDLTKAVSAMCFEFNDISCAGNWVYLRYNYDQYYDGDWHIYVASYDSDNTLIDIQAVEKGKSAVSVPEADSYEAFIWEGCMPLCDSIRLEK